MIKKTFVIGLGMLLFSSLLSTPAWAGRYVLNQSPQTIERYFGRPLALIPASESRSDEKTYIYAITGVRRVLPKLPRHAKFKVGFINNRVQSVWLDANADEDESFSYGRTEARTLFNYIFGYNPPVWQPVQLPNGGGGHEGFIDNKSCLGDGVATTYMSYRLGEENIRLFYDPMCETARLNRR